MTRRAAQRHRLDVVVGLDLQLDTTWWTESLTQCTWDEMQEAQGLYFRE